MKVNNVELDFNTNKSRQLLSFRPLTYSIHLLNLKCTKKKLQIELQTAKALDQFKFKDAKEGNLHWQRSQ
jgi:hypothetical protein